MTSIGSIAPEIQVAHRDLNITLLEQLIQLRIERGFGAVGRATLRFNDYGYQVSAGETFSLGSEVLVKEPIGPSLFEGTVTGVHLDQRGSGAPEFVAIVDDASYKLARGTQIKTYLNTSYSEVIRQMANRHGLTPHVDGTRGTFEYLLQNGTDLAFLNGIVERAGLAWWVDGKSDLHVSAPAASAPTITLTMGDNLYEFSVRASGLRPTEVQLNGWDHDQQANLRGKSAPSSSHPAQLVSSYVGSHPASDLTSASALLSEPPPLTVEEANTLATGILEDAAAAAVVAYGVCAVSGHIKPGDTVKVAGAGPASGNYLVTEVEHVFDRRGFRTRFTCGSRRPAALVDTLGAPAVDAGFQIPGLVVGVVTDNGDKAGRIKVKYAGLGGEVESPWARVVTLGGGAQRGVIFQPEVGDEVLVCFERGDTRRPVVVGGLFSEKNQLPTAGTGVAEGKVGYRRLTSRKGHIIEFADGDSPDKQHLLIQLGTAEHKLRLGGDRFDIEVAQGKPLTIKAGSAMFDINAEGNISIEGKNVTIKADGNLTLQGGQKASLASNAQTAVQGMQVQVKADGTGAVEASGPLTLKGATVAIN